MVQVIATDVANKREDVYDYDQLQYDQFYEEIFGAANKIELQWHRITEEELDILLRECKLFCVNPMD